MIEKIFASIASHMTKGLVIHSRIACMFGFLNLHGNQRCHEYHFYEESMTYRSLHNYFLAHYGKLLEEEKMESVGIIPDGWYKYMKEEVDINNKRSAIKNLIKDWVTWETETKELYERCYKQLYEVAAIDAAIFVAHLIEDVSNELAAAKSEQINLDSMGYDIVYIIDQQDDLYKHYSDKIKKLYEDDDKW